MIRDIEIQNIILKKKDEFIGFHNLSDFIKLIKRTFRGYRVKPQTHALDCMDFENINFVAIGGSYDEDEDLIYLDFYASNYEDDFIEIKPEFWKQFSFELSQTLQHELIHREQYYNRTSDFCSRIYKFDDINDKEREYLSNSDEIDAYSHDIALEIYHFYKKNKHSDVFSRISRKKHCKSYEIYENCFKGSDWKHIKNKLLKKTYKWVELRKTYE